VKESPATGAPSFPQAGGQTTLRGLQSPNGLMRRQQRHYWDFLDGGSIVSSRFASPSLTAAPTAPLPRSLIFRYAPRLQLAVAICLNLGNLVSNTAWRNLSALRAFTASIKSPQRIG
jgi:hypothetical protein